MKRLTRIIVGLLPLLVASAVVAEDLPRPSPGEAPTGLEYRLMGPAPAGLLDTGEPDSGCIVPPAGTQP